jgi:hypothetical protein
VIIGNQNPGKISAHVDSHVGNSCIKKLADADLTAREWFRSSLTYGLFATVETEAMPATG